MLENIIFPLAGVFLGILAIKLPYKYNPFRLKSGAGDNSATAQALPKIIGWLFIVSCGLWLLGVAALYALAYFLSK